MSSVIGLILAESLLSFAGIGYPLYHDWHPHLGWVPIAGVEGLWMDEGRAYIRINSAGYRDVEHARARPPGTRRVAVLGDSYTEAFQVELNRTYWWIAQERVRGCAQSGTTAEFVNFGVYAYGTAQQLLTLRSRVWDYDPDVVLLQFTTGNDVRDNSPELRQDRRRPYFVERDGELVLRPREEDPLADPAKRAYYTAVRHSRVMQLVHRARYLILNRPPDDVARQAALGGGGRLDLTYTEPTTREAEVAWRVTERLLSTINAEVRERGRRFVLAVGTNPIEVHPDRALRERTLTQIGARDFYYSVRRLQALGQHEGFDVIPLLPAFERALERDSPLLHGFDGSGTGHWNESGHRVAGQVIGDALCARWPDLVRR